MDKQTEIKTLQSLKGDTYFNQYFTNADIDMMCENIRNDFTIGCSIEKLEAAGKLERLEKLNAELSEAIMHHNKEIADRDEEINSLAIFIAEQAQKWSATDLREKAIEMMTAEEYIKFRLRRGWDLWEADKELLLKML